MPKAIKIKEINGIETYKDGRKKVAEIYPREGGYRLFTPTSRSGGFSCDYPDLATARTGTEKYIRGLFFGEVVFVTN